MPYRTFSLDEVASYLHLTNADVESLVKSQAMPFEKQGKRLIFRKVDIDSWASKRILGLEGKRLAEYHRRTSQAAQAILPEQALIPDRLRPEFIDPALAAKTKASVLREMASLAWKTGRVSDREGLLASLEAREELCSTGVPGGLALLHPRHPEPYLIETPFLALGRTVQEIPFGAPDGRPTDLFFLIGCPDDRMHLHILARLCYMVQRTELLTELRMASSAGSMFQVVVGSEAQVLKTHSAPDHQPHSRD